MIRMSYREGFNKTSCLKIFTSNISSLMREKRCSAEAARPFCSKNGVFSLERGRKREKGWQQIGWSQIGTRLKLCEHYLESHYKVRQAQDPLGSLLPAVGEVAGIPYACFLFSQTLLCFRFRDGGSSTASPQKSKPMCVCSERAARKECCTLGLQSSEKKHCMGIWKEEKKKSRVLWWYTLTMLLFICFMDLYK